MQLTFEGAIRADRAKCPCLSTNRQFKEQKMELESVQIKNTVLIETIETLQVGESSEKEQRLVSLTTQLLEAHGRQLTTERRIENLQVMACVSQADLTKGSVCL